MIDVSRIKPAILLAALYNNSKPLGMGRLQFDPSPMTECEADRLINERLRDGKAYFDYLKGRVMKVEINGKTLDPWLYDRDNGQGAAGSVVLEILTRP